ncbi:hypothetical protein [uncultured Acetobacteroides sp.]|uniref:hypothetical protein n=1 Tax=uncultured Acetobacteroides sp. TaxID=1760811 RepID=UPI0029F5C99F|nr:hypothetical protein [uncultured Acetobacteroides sp.]
MEFDCRLASINELEVLEGLSVRACNVCMNAQLKNLSEIVSYYTKFGNFLRIRNCGKRTNNELVTLCLKYRPMLNGIPLPDNVNVEELAPEDNAVSGLFAEVELLSQSQVDVLNLYIIYLFLGLTGRSSMALRGVLRDDLSLKNVWDSLVQADFNPQHIVRSRTKSFQEIVKVISAIKAQVHHLEGQDGILLLDDDFQRLGSGAFCLSDTDSTTSSSITGIRIFSLLNQLIEAGCVFPPLEKAVFTGCLVCYTDEKWKTLAELSERLGLSKERVRQIREEVYSRLLEVLFYFRTLAPNVAVQYGLDAAKPCIAIDETFVREINRSEGTSFSSQFIGKVLSVILSDRLVLLGDEFDAYYNKHLKEGYHWKRPYLIQQQYAHAYDFSMLVDHASAQAKMSRSNTIPIHLMGGISSLLKEERLGKQNEIVAVIEFLLYNEAGLTIDQHRNIVINRNVPKNETDYICEILEELRRPANADELYDKLRERCPDSTISMDNLRSRCQWDWRMIFFGKSSTYGLKAWDDEQNMKGGSIRDIVEEYLRQYDEPKHLDDITQHVLLYRNIDKKTISANLQLENSNRFKFFGRQMWGLSTKVYARCKYCKSNILKMRFG